MSDGFYNSNWDQSDQSQGYDNQAYSNSYDPNAYSQQQYGQYDQSYSAPQQQTYSGQMFTPGDGSNTGLNAGIEVCMINRIRFNQQKWCSWNL